MDNTFITDLVQSIIDDGINCSSDGTWEVECEELLQQVYELDESTKSAILTKIQNYSEVLGAVFDGNDCLHLSFDPQQCINSDIFPTFDNDRDAEGEDTTF